MSLLSWVDWDVFKRLFHLNEILYITLVNKENSRLQLPLVGSDWVEPN